MTTSNCALLDTNVLVYAADDTAPQREAARRLINQGTREELFLCVTPQVMCEFFAVITDPRRVGTPWNREKAIGAIDRYIRSRRIMKIYPTVDTLERMVDLLREHDIVRQDIFDLHLVATMLSNSITRLYTYNRADFSRFQEIEVLTP
jgi:toxin-antitoxin system PIN domain toxin